MSQSRVVLVTGASSGIGSACAEHLVESGHQVFGTSRREDFQPATFEGLVMDVTADESVRRAVAEVLERAGRIDVVVNNAGYGLAGSIEDTSIDEARQQLETNFFGALRVIQAVLPTMRSRGSGLIVNVSSLGGVFGLPFQGLYSASKFALEGLTESLRQEVRGFGIRATLVEPGDVRTAITDNRVRAVGATDASVYAQSFERALEIIEAEEAKGASPSVVARHVVRLIAEEAPRVRYSVGHFGQRLSVVAKKWFASRLFERVIMSFYGLPTSSARRLGSLAPEGSDGVAEPPVARTAGR